MFPHSRPFWFWPEFKQGQPCAEGLGTLSWGTGYTQWIVCLKVCLFKRPKQLVNPVVLDAGAPEEPRQ